MVWLALALAAEPSGEVGDEPPHASVWVASDPLGRRRLARVVRQAQRMGAEVEPVGSGMHCLRFSEAPDPDWVARAGRRLELPLESRENCSVARYPQGAGWWVAVLDPSPDLGERIEASLGRLGMTVLAQPMDGRPASLCVAALQVTGEALGSALRQGGIEVQGIHPVGSCTAQVHTLPLRP